MSKMKNESKILFVEDNLETQSIFKEIFSDFSVTICSNCKEAKQQLIQNHFDVIVFDLLLPDGTCHEIMVEMQDKLKTSSILILSAQDQYENKEIAFTHGALDYLSKPFNPKELRLKILSHLKKQKELGVEFTQLRIGSVVCNLEEQRLFLNSKSSDPMDLTIYEFRLFKTLATSPDKVFSRNDLLEKIWGNSSAVTPRTIDVHISNLRKKLKTSDLEIISKQGSGYLLHVKQLQSA